MLDGGFCPDFLLSPCNEKRVNSCQLLENRDRIVLLYQHPAQGHTQLFLSLFLLFFLPSPHPGFCCLVNVELSPNPSTFGIIIIIILLSGKPAQAGLMMLRCVFQKPVVAMPEGVKTFLSRRMEHYLILGLSVTGRDPGRDGTV